MGEFYDSAPAPAIDHLAALPKGDYPGFVYLGGFHPAPSVLFLKVGQTLNPANRVKQFNTHLPCGLTFMAVAPVDRWAHLLHKEADLMEAVGSIEGCDHVNGEWYRVPIDRLIEALEAMREIVGSAYKLEFKPAQKRSTTLSDCTFMRRIEAEDAAKAASDYKAFARSIKGVSGAYTGTLRG